MRAFVFPGSGNSASLRSRRQRRTLFVTSRGRHRACVVPLATLKVINAPLSKLAIRH
jgi:hypothetical protein